MKVVKTEMRCDLCSPGKYGTQECVTVRISTGKDPDPSGHGHQEDIREVDVCHDCLSRILQKEWERGLRINGLPENTPAYCL